MTKASFNSGEAASESEPPPRKRQKLSPPIPSFNTTTSTSTLSATNENKSNVEKMEESNTQTVVSDNGFQPDRELEVGILHFVNTTNPGFSGILKQRYTDFLVNEIQPDGTVVHLTDDKAPQAKPIPKDNPLPVPRAKPLSEQKDDVSQSTAADLKPESTSTANPTDNAYNNVNQMSNSDTPTEDSKKDAPNVTYSISPKDEDVLVLYFGIILKDQLLKFHEKILSKPGAKPGVFGLLLSESITDRVLRGRIHQDIRRIFESRIETESIEDGKIKITAAPRSVAAQHGKNGPPIAANQMGRGRGPPGQAKGKVGWNELGGEYLHFTLYKENKDTMEVLAWVARSLHVKPRDFAFAGTKDRRAATVQRVSIFRQYARNLAKVNGTFKPGARIGNFKHEKYQLELGELAGNLFQVTLRDCHFGDDAGMNDDARVQFANEVVGQAVKHIQEHGFINYFGLQRFGTFGIGTDTVGKLILQEDFEGAVKALLTYNNDSLAEGNNPTDRVGRDDIARAAALKLFEETGQGQKALDILPRKFGAEAAVIRHLSVKNRSSDYCGAMLMIPRNLRTMYVHAYQSLVWNMVASERWARYGSKLVEGDLVLVDNQATNGKGIQDEVDENGEIVIHPSAGDAAVQHNDIYERARALTAGEAESSKYSIFDIILPTPGFDIEYPGNDIGDFYKNFMGSERGGGLDPGNMRRNQKDFSLSGSYRKLLAQVGKDLSFEVKTYHQETEQFIETDLEKIIKSRPQVQKNSRSQHHHENGPRRNQNGFYNQQNNNPHSRDKLSDSPRHGYQRNLNDGHNGGSQSAHSYQAVYTDVRLEQQDEQQAAKLSAWQALPAKLEAEDKAAAAAAEQKKLIEPPVDPDSIKQPEYQETYIETFVDENGRRTVGKSTKMVGADGALRDVQKEDIKTTQTVSFTEVTSTVMGSGSVQSVNSTPAASKPVKTKDEPESTATLATNMEVDSMAIVPSSILAPKDVKSEEKLESTNTSIVDELDGGVKLSPKIAVIVKFALGSSQYATMALRELMKAGGVKTYKPDFSSGR